MGDRRSTLLTDVIWDWEIVTAKRFQLCRRREPRQHFPHSQKGGAKRAPRGTDGAQRCSGRMVWAGTSPNPPLCLRFSLCLQCWIDTIPEPSSPPATPSYKLPQPRKIGNWLHASQASIADRLTSPTHRSAGLSTCRDVEQVLLAIRPTPSSGFEKLFWLRMSPGLPWQRTFRASCLPDSPIDAVKGSHARPRTPAERMLRLMVRFVC